MNKVMNHAKSIPDPRKYSKIIKWSEDSSKNNGKFNKEAKVTLFQQIAKEAKGKPGPGTYHPDKSKDKMVLMRTTGTYKSGNEKVSILESQSFEKKNIPGPQHKYKVNYGLVLPREPFYVNLQKNPDKKAIEVIKKDKNPGPNSYKTENAYKRNSQYQQLAKNIPISGMGVTNGAKE